jgi:hypothetical protein
LNRRKPVLFARSALLPVAAEDTRDRSSAADNDSGTYSNPLFYYHGCGSACGFADFDNFQVDERCPRAYQTDRLWPVDCILQFGQRQRFIGGKYDRLSGPRSRVGASRAPSANGKHLIAGPAGELRLTQGRPAAADSFQWVDLQRGDTLLLSLVTHCYLIVPLADGPATARPSGSGAGLQGWFVFSMSGGALNSIFLRRLCIQLYF